MPKRHCCLLAGIAVVTLLSGCVERRMTIMSNPRGAKVYVNGKPIGYTPVEYYFTYYGTYTITLEKDGFQTQVIQQRIAPPFYAYPPIDFLAENIYPGTIQDIRELAFDLQPIPRPNLEELRQQAEDLRARGRALPEPKYPPDAKKGPANGPMEAPPGTLPPPNPAPPGQLPPPNVLPSANEPKKD